MKHRIVLYLVALAALLWSRRQRRIISRKNRILVQQQMEIDRMNARAEEQAAAQSHAEEQAAQPHAENLDAELDDEALYDRLCQAIVTDRLYLDPKFGRQAAIDRFHLSKERLGSLFSQSSDHHSIINFINNCRLNHARQLLAATQLSIDEVAQQSGFGTRQTFTRNFVRRFGLTPTEYHSQMASPQNK